MKKKILLILIMLISIAVFVAALILMLLHPSSSNYIKYIFLFICMMGCTGLFSAVFLLAIF